MCVIDYMSMLKKQSIHSHLSAQRRLGLIARYLLYCSIVWIVCLSAFFMRYFTDAYNTENGGALLLAK